MRTNLTLAIFTLILIIAGGCAAKKEDSKDQAEEQNDAALKKSDTKEDAEWAVDVADGGMLEVKVAELAQANSKSADVKSFAAMMIKDHTAANSELKTLATQKGITLPMDLSNKSRDTYDDLSKKTGNDFDDAYTDLMVKDHEKTVDAFKKEAEKGNDPDLKSWASGKLATLEHHLEMAKQTDDKADKADKADKKSDSKRK